MRGGRVVTLADAKTLGAWTQAVKWAAKSAGVTVIDRNKPVMLDVLFMFVRPKSAKDRQWHTVKPDLDKMLRAVKDALTGVAYEDDAQVVRVVAMKGYGMEAETEITVRVA